MPNRRTFKVKPIESILNRYVGNGVGWVDPFANESKIAQFTNDIESRYDTGYHLDAIDFVRMFASESINGILLDPPYSYRQAFKTYKTDRGTNVLEHVPFSELSNVASSVVKPGGYSISFGWNSNGLGMKRGFDIVEILLVAHGGQHNDTIVTVEKKRNQGRISD